MANNKIQLADGTVLLDISSDTVVADKLASGYVAHDKSGTRIIGTVAEKSSSDVTVNNQMITVPAGMYSSQVQKSVATGSAGTPSISKSEVSNNQVTLTPSVTNTTGFINGGTKTGNNVIVKASDLVNGTLNITSNGNYDVTNKESVNVSVEGSGGGMNVQAYIGYETVKTISYTATAVSLTVAKTGTYRVSWMGWRNTSFGTSGSQLYIGDTAYGSANTSFTNIYGQAVTLTDVSLTAGQTITVRARARSTSHIMVVGNLIIEQTA